MIYNNLLFKISFNDKMIRRIIEFTVIWNVIVVVNGKHWHIAVYFHGFFSGSYDCCVNICIWN